VHQTDTGITNWHLDWAG